MVRTVNDAYLDLRNDLRMAGVEGFQIEARELICYALDIPREKFYDKRGELVFEHGEQKIERVLKQRLSGTPVQYITGQWEFYGLTLDVSRDTLIPRADTELLAEVAIKALEDRSRGRLLDLCCGTGCVGIAVLKNVSDGVTGVFADKSSAAMHVARKNIMRHFLSARAYTVNVDALLPAPENIGRFNFIVCNPPYVRTGDIPTLDREVRQEPLAALDGGEDGLDFYRAIPENFKPVLAPNATLAFEVGMGQAFAVMDILGKCGYTDIKSYNDLRGVERVVTGTYKEF
ncbi:MAG: peptide chain release factor N(5)-glutamine methyltransferase [Clostridia bacterium]|nr:peptide chain release factor N(5)-glutamine methyltransferase [Clostridia bacterium]